MWVIGNNSNVLMYRLSCYHVRYKTRKLDTIMLFLYKPNGIFWSQYIFYLLKIPFPHKKTATKWCISIFIIDLFYGAIYH